MRTTIPEPSGQKVPDLLQAGLHREAVNERYVGDITYLPIGDGTNLYLATVIDCYSRRLAGWAVADHMRTELVEDALKAAAATRAASRARSSTPTTGRSTPARTTPSSASSSA